MNEPTKKTARFGDYMYILFKWKKFIFINLFIVAVLSVTYTLLLPLQYKATATITLPPEQQMGLGGLTNLMGGKSSLASMGARLFGVTNQSEDVMLGLLNSRSALTKIIGKFDLMSYYEISNNNMDKALKAFRNDISTDPNEFGMIDFSVINKDPKFSAEIANYMVSLADSMNIELNIRAAKNNRIFIEQRYLKNIEDLRKAEDSLYRFQKKYGIVAIPEQLEVTVQAAAVIETELIKKEVEAYFIEQTYGKNSIQFAGVNAEIKLLREKVEELKNSNELYKSSNILYPFKDMPNIAIQYLRAFREVEIQQTIMEFVLPMYEQAKVEEQKSIPTLLIIDKAVPPDLKYSPKRAAIVLGLLFLFSFILIPFVFWGERVLTRAPENPLQVNESKFFTRLIKLYRIKF
jgi:capsule polysaccharide export protein KpsE/RkpR